MLGRRPGRTRLCGTWPPDAAQQARSLPLRLAELGDGPLNLDMKPPSGIGGQDPRKHASAKVGQRNAELTAEALGRKAWELLESLPEDQRSFHLKAVSPEHWWMV